MIVERIERKHTMQKTLSVNDVVKSFPTLSELRKESKEKELNFHDLFNCEINRYVMLKLFKSFKQTKVKSVLVEYGDNEIIISSTEFNFEYRLIAKTKGVIMSAQQTIASNLKLEMTVKDLQNFLSKVKPTAKLQIDYPNVHGMVEDQVSLFEYDKKDNVLKLNPLDTLILNNYDNEYQNDIKKHSDLVYAFSPEHKKITQKSLGRK
jgi:hypothetical protein